MALWKFIRLLALVPFFASAQHYSAVNGSSYIGSLNVHNNPSSIVNSPFKWDITLFGLQQKQSTNAVQVLKYSLLSNPANSEYVISPGNYKRFGDINTNLNLLNTRIALNRTSAIAFGMNLKSYVTLKTSQYNFIDTISRFSHFFLMNEGTRDLSLDMVNSSWAEFYASYGRTILDNERIRLNAGISLKVNRGLSGAFAHLSSGNFTRVTLPGDPTYSVTNAPINFGYSSNYDTWDSTRKFGSNFREFTSTTEGGLSADIGLEWLVKLPVGNSAQDDDDGYYDYDWKIGVSLLDIGHAQYHYGEFSTIAKTLRQDISDISLDKKFDSTVTSLRAFRDSLFTLYTDAGTPPGLFRVNHPTRLLVNVDKFISGAFYVNADLSMNLSGIGSSDNQRVKDMSLLTLTGRWETRKKGFYLPVYFNTNSQVWIGGAFRLGPVLFGVHNWANLFSKNKIHRGGGYLAIILKPSAVTDSRKDKRLDCYW